MDIAIKKTPCTCIQYDKVPNLNFNFNFISSANRTMYIICLSPIGQNNKLIVTTTTGQHYTTIINNLNSQRKEKQVHPFCL